MASTADLEAEILAELEENPDAYVTPVNDVITIDPETRTIHLPASEMLFGVEEEKDVERKFFKCPRIVGDNIDLAAHQIYISYMAVKDKNATLIPELLPETYWCDDVALDETGNYITFSWLLSGNVLRNRGFVGFAVIAKSMEGEMLKTRWKTAPAVGTVLMTIPDGASQIVEAYPDIIAQLLDKMNAVEEYLAENPPSGMTAEEKEQLDKNTEDISSLSEEIAAIPSGKDGADGKSAYQYAQEGGYTGTETEFAEKMAQEKFANPNALTFTGAVSATYDGSAPVSVEIPSGGGGGSSGGSGKAKSQILIDQEITELTASLSVTLEHDFHNLIAIINCGSAGAALTAGSDGTVVASKIGLMIDTNSFGYNSRKVADIDTTSATWQTRMVGAEWSDDLSVFKRGFAAEIVTGAPNKAYYFSFGGTSAMYGTLGTEDNAPRTGKTANIVVNGAYLNVGTRVILWGEYYE